jgi:hypothetical protein
VGHRTASLGPIAISGTPDASRSAATSMHPTRRAMPPLRSQHHRGQTDTRVVPAWAGDAVQLAEGSQAAWQLPVQSTLVGGPPVGEVSGNYRRGRPRAWPRSRPRCARRRRRAAGDRELAVVITVGRPPVRPRARAAASPAWVRSRIRSRSNSASAPNRWKTSLPPGVVVSRASATLRNPTPRSSRVVTVSIRWRRERPSRSSFHTTRVSPGRSWSRTLVSSGRASSEPDAVSVKTR